jgi:hypothetical protein
MFRSRLPLYAAPPLPTHAAQTRSIADAVAREAERHMRRKQQAHINMIRETPNSFLAGPAG